MVKAMAQGDHEQKEKENKELICLPGESIRCTAHLLNLAVQDVFDKEDSPLIGLKHRCHKITKIFNKSSSANAALLKEQREAKIEVPKKVHADVRHRWNSTYLMMSRLLELKQPVTQILQAHDALKIRLRALSPLEWELMNEVVHLLRPLYDATVIVSGETYPTLALVHMLFSGFVCLLTFLIALGIVDQIKKRITPSEAHQPSPTAVEIGEVLHVLSKTQNLLDDREGGSKSMGEPHQSGVCKYCFGSSNQRFTFYPQPQEKNYLGSTSSVYSGIS